VRAGEPKKGCRDALLRQVGRQPGKWHFSDIRKSQVFRWDNFCRSVGDKQTFTELI
jgi:hypothetical protein